MTALTVHLPAAASRSRWRARPAGVDPASAARRRARLVALARVLDNRFRLPGLGVRVGIDPLLGLLPGAGDAISAAIHAYILVEAWRLGATRRQLAAMLANVAIDTLAGSLPVVGDVFDVAFKASVRNLKIMGIDASAPGPG